MARWNDSHGGRRWRLLQRPASHIGKETLPMLYGPEGSEKEVLAGYHTMSDVLRASKLPEGRVDDGAALVAAGDQRRCAHRTGAQRYHEASEPFY